MKTEFSNNRRTFIKGAAIFSGLAALLGMASPSKAKPKEPLPQPERSHRPDQGYQLTEHVKRYYETARM
jgi:hypothetical protein